ncbi:MAG: hypothetical protein ABIQ99_07810 [Thermoflexales bacterium]
MDAKVDPGSPPIMSWFSLPGRPFRAATYAGFALFILGMAVATANIHPFDSDAVANLVAVRSIVPDGTLYLPAHSNAIKTPIYLLAHVLFGYSSDAIVFADIASTAGFFALAFACVMVWTRGSPRPHTVAIPLAYLACLSPHFIWLFVNPGNRNLDIGLSLAWLAIILTSRLRRGCALLSIALTALLVINDPWFVTTFALPAAAVLFLVAANSTSAAPVRSRWAPPVILALGVALGFALRSSINATGIVKFAGSETDYMVVAADRLGFNIGLAMDALLRYFNAWVFGQPLLGEETLKGMANLAVVSLGIAGLISGARAADERLRKISLWGLIALAISMLLYVFTSAAVDASTARYLIIAPIMTSIGLAIGLTQWRNRGLRLQLGILGLIGACLVANLFAVSDAIGQWRTPNRFESQQIVLDALKTSGMRDGYSDYWNGLSYTYHSADAVRIRALICDGQRVIPFNWLSQSRWYAPDPERRPTFMLLTFPEQATLAKCGRAGLLNQFGASRSMFIDKGNTHIAEILIWDYDIAARLP